MFKINGEQINFLVGLQQMCNYELKITHVDDFNMYVGYRYGDFDWTTIVMFRDVTHLNRSHPWSEAFNVSENEVVEYCRKHGVRVE